VEIDRQIAEFTTVDPVYGAGVKAALKKKLKVTKALH